MSPNECFPVIDSKKIHENDFFRLLEEKLKLPDGSHYSYFTLHPPPYAVMVLATTAQQEFVLNWEYRHPTKKNLLSCPGGIMHENESPIDCAKRELNEETGFDATQFEIIGEAYPFPGVCSQKTIYVRCGNAFRVGKQSLEKAECIETELFSMQALQKALQSGVPIDGLLLTALFLNQNPLPLEQFPV
jgi:ADP-ribose pyrophosphatase